MSSLYFSKVHVQYMYTANYVGRRPLFYCCSLDLYTFFRRLISEVAWPSVTKLCHKFFGDPDL